MGKTEEMACYKQEIQKGPLEKKNWNWCRGDLWNSNAKIKDGNFTPELVQSWWGFN